MRVCIEQETEACVECVFPEWMHYCPICGWNTVSLDEVKNWGKGPYITMEFFHAADTWTSKCFGKEWEKESKACNGCPFDEKCKYVFKHREF